MKKERNVSAKSTNRSTKTTIIQTGNGLQNGQNKCPKCGSTDISLNPKTGNLRCNFCRYEFAEEKLEDFSSDLSKLEGQMIGSGVQDRILDTNDIITLKCTSCGAEVVIDTREVTQARCHWCRNTLSIQEQIPNGSIPDMVLPFHVTKMEAQKEIEKFVGKRKFFAHPQFQKEFTTENIMGVYFPYMVIDENAHASFIGEGEQFVRSYVRGNNQNQMVYYDADLYHVEREFDLTISDLTLESKKDRLDGTKANQTNNVINAIMPFDIENAVKWNANYLKGYTSERRDTNIDELKDFVEIQSKDIARFAASETLKQYDRGVRWENEEFQMKGQEWKAAYLPVWLYSYQQEKNQEKILHYVAVNARTKEVMGSVPIHYPKLLIVSFFLELIGIFLMFTVDFDYSFLFATIGFFYYFVIWNRYRNKSERHHYEKETKTEMKNIRKVDRFIQRERNLSNATIRGANYQDVSNQSFAEKIKKTFYQD